MESYVIRFGERRVSSLAINVANVTQLAQILYQDPEHGWLPLIETRQQLPLGVTVLEFPPIRALAVELRGFDLHTNIMGIVLNEWMQHRLMTVEEELDAITQDAITVAGSGLARDGKEVFVVLGDNLEFVPSGPGGALAIRLKNTIAGDYTIVGYVTTSKAVEAEDGHGQFIDAPSFSAGKSNLRNGITRYYCIDTANHIEIESPEAIASNRKQYLQDKDGKIPVEESDGMIGSEGGFKVNDVQVVGERISGWTAPVGSYDRTGGFDADNPDLGRLAQFVAALYYDLAAHGLIGED